jgi:hypothetical protein
MNRSNQLRAVVLSVTLVYASPLFAQSSEPRFQAGLQFVGVNSGEFEGSDFGVSGLFSWHPMTLVGLEGEVGLYPKDFGSPRAFSANRSEGLFGLTVGPRLGRLRPFAKLRPGFLRFAEAPAPFPCILIFPPPLRCTLAGGKTVAAFDLGGGVEWLATNRTFVRFDAGDRVLRYPSPSIDRTGAVHDSALVSHDLRLSVGAGLRF